MACLDPASSSDCTHKSREQQRQHVQIQRAAAMVRADLASGGGGMSVRLAGLVDELSGPHHWLAVFNFINLLIGAGNVYKF